MIWRVLRTDQAQEWRETVAGHVRADVYFLPEYHRVYERNGDGVARAFVAQDEDKVLFYPFMMRLIEKVAGEAPDEEWFDIETVYGYSGPVSNTADPAFLSEAWNFFSEWCRKQRIVAEFVRFNPLLENHRTLDLWYSVSFDRETVMIKLAGGEETLWQSYPSVQRNMVRKALKNGLECGEMEPARGMPAFKQLYYQTMARAGATPYYFFSGAYFESLVNLLADHLRLFVVRRDDLIVGASLLLSYGDTVHYHLSASLEGYQQFAPTNLLLHTAALWCLEHGYRKFHLGGGRTPGPDDSLLQFKSRISKLRCRYYTGRRVHNAEAYEALCLRWMKAHNVHGRPDYFLLYRLEDF